MLKNFANFTRFSLLFSTKKVTGSLIKLSESIFKAFILCFQSYLCSFCTISSGLRVQFRHLLANLRKIYIHDVNIDASQADRALNWSTVSPRRPWDRGCLNFWLIPLRSLTGAVPREMIIACMRIPIHKACHTMEETSLIIIIL